MKIASLASRQFDRILLIKPSAFGDVLHTLPVLVKLRARYPAARIDWLITPENAELVRYHPALSNVILFARRDYARWSRLLATGAGLLRLVDTIQRTQYDLAIDLHGQLRSALFTLVSGAPVRIGFDRPGRAKPWRGTRADLKGMPAHGWRGSREGSWLAYSHRIPVPTLDVHAVDRYLWLAPFLGLDDAPPDLRVYWSAAAAERAESCLRRHGLQTRSFAILMPGTIWQTKHWREEGFAAVGRYLTQQGVRVVLAGSLKDRPRCQAIAQACPGAWDLSGQTTLSELAALMNRAVVNVTNDSGPMHLAVALDRPVVAIFGPTNPTWVGPYRRPRDVVRAELACSPCYFRRLSQCPHDHACMKQVTAEQVIDRLKHVLAQRAIAG